MNAPGVQGGEAVFLSGVRIGITGRPSVFQGKVRVPVRIMRRHHQALTANTIFLLVDDPQAEGHVCLVGYPFDFSGEHASGKGKHFYPGASSRAELALLIGGGAAQGLWERLERWTRPRGSGE